MLDNPKCSTCRWFIERTTCKESRSIKIGRCRKNAPSINGWPIVWSVDMCGQWEVNESSLGKNKINR